MKDQLSQQELEQPAKVYQLEAVYARIAGIDDKLCTILNNTSNIVTQEQRTSDVNILNERIDSEVSCFKKDNRRIFWSIIGVAIAFVADSLARILRPW